MNIQIVTNFFKKNKAVLLYVAVFLWFFILSSESLFANAQSTWLSEEDKWAIIEKVNLLITWAAALMGMVTSFITMFLYPGWTNGTLFWLQDYLKEIWILVSNIVYFIFAFILVTIAFMNIIGKGDWNWELKQAMPKFVVWVLIVPFSWFFVQFLLSISAILTVWVLTLPYDSFSDHDLFVQALDNTELAWEEICKDIIISLNWDFGDKQTDGLNSEEWNLDENIQCLEGGKVSIKELITWLDENWDVSEDAAWLQNSIFGVISIYSYWILRIQDLDTISWRDLETIETLVDLIFKVVFDVLFVIVYLLLMVALLLALFVRWVRLWIYMMLSPVFWLFYFFGSSEVSGDSGWKFGVKEFIHLALIPVYVSWALAFWLVFIMVASEWVKEVNDWEDVLKAWGFSLTILWAHGSGESEKSVIWKLIVEIFGIAILWIAVMFALSKSETTKNIIKPIADFWQSVWKLAAAAPTYAPIIPTWKWADGKQQYMWVAGLSTIWSSIEAAPRQAAQKRWGDFADRLIWDAGPVQQIQRDLRSATETQKRNWEALETALQNMWQDLFKSNPQREQSINSINRELWLDIDLWRETDPRRVAQIIQDAIDEHENAWLMNGTFRRNHDSLLAFVEWIKNGTNVTAWTETSWDTDTTWDATTQNVSISIRNETWAISTTPSFNKSELEFEWSWDSMSVDINTSIRNSLETVISEDVSYADALSSLRDHFDNDQARAILRALWKNED